MSLINDALKRASRTPGAAPRDLNTIALRPVEAADQGGSSLVRKTVPVLLVIAVVMAMWFLWQYFQGATSPVQARTPGAKTARATAANPVQASPEASVPSTAVEVERPLLKATPPTLPETVASTKAPKTVEMPEPAPIPAVVNPVVATVEPVKETPPAPAPAPVVEARPFPNLKLVGLSYHPTRGSALINGKFVFVGDRVEGARVTKITRDGVTLEFDGQTRTLSVSN